LPLVYVSDTAERLMSSTAIQTSTSSSIHQSIHPSIPRLCLRARKKKNVHALVPTISGAQGVSTDTFHSLEQFQPPSCLLTHFLPHESVMGMTSNQALDTVHLKNECLLTTVVRSFFEGGPWPINFLERHWVRDIS